jgi:hypothetical protein
MGKNDDQLMILWASWTQYLFDKLWWQLKRKIYIQKQFRKLSVRSQPLFVG